MYELGIILIVAPLTFIVLPNILVPFTHWCDRTGEFSPEAKRRRKLLRRLGRWEMEIEYLTGSEDSADYIHAAEQVSMLRKELEEVN